MRFEMVSLGNVIDSLIYASVLLGLGLLVQLYYLVPSWLFYSVLVGWCVYAFSAVVVSLGFKRLYPLVFVLAVMTLVLSLPQPEHSAYLEAGLSLASLTFVAGSVLQTALIILIPTYYIRKRGGTK